MTYNVFGGTLNLAQSKPSVNKQYHLCWPKIEDLLHLER